MRTIAIKVEDEVHQQLTLLAQLSERPLVDELREAIDTHIARRSDEVDLTAQAQSALEEIDREAASRRQAIEGLLKGRPGASKQQTTSKSRRKSGGSESE